MKVSVNSPRTPVTQGSSGVAAATVPNVCKMPGPPAPFVPTPLPNIGNSGDSPKGYSKGVEFEGHKVAIKGASFKSTGDIASKGTGGGLISSNTHGPTKFVGPGSLDVKVEGKNVHLLGDPMLNNCGPGGSPPNAATLVGVLQATGGMIAVFGDEACPLCGKTHGQEGRLAESTSTQGAVSQLEAAIDAALAEANAATTGVASGQAVVDAKNAMKAALVQAAAAATKAEKKPFNLAVAEAQQAVRGAIGLSAMMGAAQCKCGQKYVGTSTVQYKDVVKRVPFHAPNPYHSLREQPDKDRFRTRRFKKFQDAVAEQHRDRFTKVWQGLKDLSDQSALRLTDEVAYPPGSCAAQLVVLLALNHQCRPVGLTERWYTSKGSKLSKLKVRDLDEDGLPGPARMATDAELCGDRPIPPCGTCQIVLQALMCTDGEASLQCSHQKPPKKVCSRC